jgi:hypothetical protein
VRKDSNHFRAVPEMQKSFNVGADAGNFVNLKITGCTNSVYLF